MTGVERKETIPFIELARDFARKELLEKREEHDSFPFGAFWSVVIARAYGVGFFGMNVPEEYGGIGRSGAPLAPVLREIARVDASLAAALFTNAAAFEILNAASAHADCADAYRRLSSGSGVPAAFLSFTHPGETAFPRAEPAGDGCSISGYLDFLTLGGIADYAVIPARLAGQEGFSYFSVDLTDPAVRRSDTVFSLGLHGCPAVDAVLAAAPAKLIGAEGRGMDYYRAMRERLSIAAAAISLGIMEGSYGEASSYADERVQGGKTISQWPEVRMMLARMAAAIERYGAALDGAGNSLGEAAALALALGAADESRDVTATGVQILGGNGYMKDYGQEKRLRDAHQICFLLGMEHLRMMDLAALMG